uniref:3-beta-hydroxylase-like n=1 Tax=Erigeron canadensis TaxID=72917 RepID=UPI001CB92C99|nr:3-beta-hydroxylase-like [Erigeron canadensis]
MLFIFQDLLSSLLLPLLTLVIAILSKWYFFPSKIIKNLPPSPTKLPIIGNLHQLGSSPHRSLQALAKKHGPLMLLHFGRVPVVVVSSADASREIMKTNDLLFANRAKSSVPSILSYNARDIAFADYGEYWRQIKSIAVLQLLSQKRVQSFRRMREEETDLLIERIKNLSRSSSSVINLSELIILLTNGVICRAALGRKHEDKKFKELFAHFVELLGVFSVGDYIPWLSWVDRLNGYDARAVKIAAEFDTFLEGVIKEHVDKNKQTSSSDNDEDKDFVDILLEIQNEKDANFALDRDTVKALILDVFTGGTDSTYATLEWELSELLRNPQTLKRLQNEVRQVAKGKPRITDEDLEQMHYLKAVVKETFRMHTPLPLLVPRESTQDVKVMGYDIAAGTQVLINAWAVGRDPCIWVNPDEFQPERFLNSCVDYKGVHFELTPFGAGRRKCPGIQFAMSVNELALAKLVHKFDFVLPDGQKGEDLDMSETTGITVHKKLPLLVVATAPYV